METWEALTMSRKEVWRPGLIRALVAGQYTNGQVGAGLRLSIRQVQRLKRRFGRRPDRCTPETLPRAGGPV